MLCFQSPTKHQVALRFVFIFALLKLGWAIGVFLFMTLPKQLPSPLWGIAAVVLFLLMGIIDLVLFVRMSRTNEESSPETHPIENAERHRSFEQSCSEAAAHYNLTPREAEILVYLAKGRSASYIQQELTISGGTVRTHTDHIYKKLDVHSQQELIDIIESFATPTRKK